MGILKFRDADGNIKEIIALKGEKGEKGDPGEFAGGKLLEDHINNKSNPHGVNAMSDLGIVDYVIAEGGTNGWRWKKWISGFAECCIHNAEVSLAGQQNAGNLFYAENIWIALPFPLQSLVGATGSVDYQRTIGDIELEEVGKAYVSFTVSANHTIGSVAHVSLYIVGRWGYGGSA